MDDDTALETLARGLPSQGGAEIGPFLRQAARAVPNGTAIVELGSWLGAGTAQLAMGARGHATPPAIHVYDKFRATEGEVAKAARFGLTLKQGQNTLPIVRGHLAPFGVDVTLHRGSLWDADWTGGPIGLHVDDAAKTRDIFLHVLRTFGPSWVPGVTVVVLMDFDLWRAQPDAARAEAFRAQHDVVAAHAHAFSPIPDAAPAGTPTRFFRYAAPIDFGALPRTSRRPSLGQRLGRLLPGS